MKFTWLHREELFDVPIGDVIPIKIGSVDVNAMLYIIDNDVTYIREIWAANLDVVKSIIDTI